MKRIRAIIKDGKIKLKVEGVSGPSCTAMTKPFEKALGTTEKSEKTPDFYQSEQEQQNQKQH